MTVTAAATARPVTPLGILAARLEALSRQVLDLDEVPVAMAMELRTLAQLASGLDPYVERCTTPESPALRALAERTAATDWSAGTLEQEMLSGHVEGQLLAMLVHATRARRVLEIGMFTGYSALAIAEALPPGGVVVALELDPGVAALARESFAASPAGERIDVRVGPAVETLRGLVGQVGQVGREFDLVFIDADKAGYVDYLDALLDGGLLAPHGLVVVDNTLLQGEPWMPAAASANGAAIAAFNDLVAADPRVAQVLLPVRDGVTLIRRTGR